MIAFPALFSPGHKGYVYEATRQEAWQSEFFFWDYILLSQ
jgi:hypothetical protein